MGLLPPQNGGFTFLGHPEAFKRSMETSLLSPCHTGCTHAGRTRRTIKLVRPVRRCAPNFCPYFGEAIASSQRMYSLLLAHWPYTGRIPNVCIAYTLKFGRIGAHPGCLWKVWEENQHQGSLDYHL